MSTAAEIKCPYCGSGIPHDGLCPEIKAVDYYPDGTLKRVELLTPKDRPAVIAAESTKHSVNF